ncbi:hypothetical protein HA402_001337 [Bradysia odoriphaga]|nr:hypothetical protein HA402_001337 [Bradysia odoriphaga]
MERRPAKVSNIETNVVWKIKPPGPEQRELERMFRSNEIEPGESADSVRRSSEMFHRFSAAVFGNHFRTTKAKFAKEGSYAKVSNGERSGTGSDGIGIPKLTGTGELPSDRTVQCIEMRQTSIRFTNPPYWVWKYFDHEVNMEFVCVALVSICGIRNEELEIAADGYTLYIRYVWPTAIFKHDETFKKAVNPDGTRLANALDTEGRNCDRTTSKGPTRSEDIHN